MFDLFSTYRTSLLWLFCIVPSYSIGANGITTSHAPTLQAFASEPPTVPDVVSTLSVFNIPQALQFSLYHRTQPPFTRSVHFLPSLSLLIEPVQCDNLHNWTLSIEPFFNFTDKVNFTHCSTQIPSYIALDANSDFLETLDVKAFSSVNVPAVLSLFQPATLQERRLGLMLGAWKQHENWAISAALPIYYQERNLFLDDEQLSALEDSPLLAGPGRNLPGFNYDTFTTDHLIRDCVGLGDLRLQALYNVSQKNFVQIGAQITLPTATSVARGIVGGTGTSGFSKKLPPPLIDFYKLFYLQWDYQDNNNKQAGLQLEELMVNYGLLALDRLTTMIADMPLGNPHVSFGPIIQGTKRCNTTIDFLFTGEFQYSVPANELRFFNVIKNPFDFTERDYTSDDPSVAEANLLFLDQQARNTLYPAAVKIETKPGMILHTKTGFAANWTDSLKSTIGYDFWLQGDEKLGPIKQRYGIPGTLELAKGTKRKAYEGKIFADLSTIFADERYVLFIGLRADATVHHRGIGASTTLGLNLKLDF